MLYGQRVLTWPDDDAELRKTITTVLADPVGAIVFDNLTEGTVIDSPVLARLVTDRTWTDRRLGGNTAVSYPNDRLWLATGNNLRTGGDTASRTIWVRPDPDMPHPETRTGFAIPQLDTWILDPANQATVLFHLLVLILDWTSAGAPTSRGLPAMRQFTTWARHLGGFCDHHGLPGFLANAAEARDLDDDHTEWQTFLTRWHRLHGEHPMTAHDLRASAEPATRLPDPWAGVFLTTRTGALPSVKSLGRLLTGQIGRWRGDVVLRSETDPAKHGRVYWVDRHTLEIKPANPQTAGHPR